MDVVCQAAATSSERATAQMMSALDFWFLMGTIQWWSDGHKKKKQTAQQTPPIEVLMLYGLIICSINWPDLSVFCQGIVPPVLSPLSK